MIRMIFVIQISIGFNPAPPAGRAQGFFTKDLVSFVPRLVFFVFKCPKE